MKKNDIIILSDGLSNIIIPSFFLQYQLFFKILPILDRFNMKLYDFHYTQWSLFEYLIKIIN